MRLIDADELKTAFPTCDNSKPVLVASVRATINHMPTIEQPEPCEDAVSRTAVLSLMDDFIDGSFAWAALRTKIARLPSVVPARKRGKWICHDPHVEGLCCTFTCDQCGDTVDCVSTNFCPNCGADMRGETS